MSDSASLLINAIQNFQRTVEITRDVRFLANSRLSKRHRASAYIISMLSTYVIALSLIPNIFRLEEFQSQLLLACSIVLSVFVIFTSLIDGSQNFFHQGELLHQCARKIANIVLELRTLDPETNTTEAKQKLQELQKRYRDALDECPVNHDNVDYWREMVNKPNLFRDRFPGRWTWLLRYWMRFRVSLPPCPGWLFM